MYKWRIFIDESGDHTYKHVDSLDTRYLGLTGVVILKDYYDKHAQAEMENLKRRLFKYDPDDPPIFVRSNIKHRKRWFYVLQDKDLNERWEGELLQYLASLIDYAQVFTVVIDKKRHLEKFPFQTFDPYAYSLVVLLNRIKGYLIRSGGQADVIAESRGGVEDQQIIKAYMDLRSDGTLPGSYNYGTAEEFQKVYPESKLIVKRKDSNIAGLQVADVIAYGQKVQTVLSKSREFSRPLSDFDSRINGVVDKMVNQYGRYLLD